MRARHLRFTAFALSLLVSLIGLPASAKADVNNFTVTDFSANYYLNRSDPQGALTVKERLTVDFTDNNHGILRALPERYNGQDEHIHIIDVIRDGTNEQFTTYTSNGNLVLKIGRADQTITGRHVYDIDYDVQNVIRFTSNGDELDWNTNGTQWGQPFLAETASLHLAPNLKATYEHCYTGWQGSTENQCNIFRTADGYNYMAGRTLNANETMTFVARFPTGTFQKPTFRDWLHDYGGAASLALLVFLVPSLVAYRKWHKDGKDIKGRGTVVPEYAPPAGVRAAEADTILHYKPSNKAVSATLIDLAIRGHLKIVETKNNGVLGIGKHNDYSFEKLEAATDTLNGYETTLYQGLFKHGSTTTPKDLKGTYYTSVNLAKGGMENSVTDAGYLYPRRLTGWWLWTLGTALVIFGLGIHSVVSFGMVPGGLVVLLFAKLMPRRPQKGVDAKDQLAGLKLYMNTAEKDRLKMLQSVDAPYAERSSEPTKTVELFEKLLPYAIGLGVEDSWAKQFEGIYTSPPDWYAGNWASFNTGYLIGSLNDSIGAMNSSFAAPSSSGSGGGGGFAGGGGGGGGGGGW